MQDLKDKEAQLESLIQNGEKGDAVASLYELIVAYAKQKDFAKAEALRERLYELDPMAIREIAQTGDIIEQEKSQSLDREHMELWSGLYKDLNPEETNELYYSLIPASFDPDSPLFQEGDTDRSLYFLEKGQLKLSFHKGGKEIYLTTLQAGETVGAETFFARTWERTFSAVPLTTIQANVLHPSALDKREQDSSNLQSVIYDFCFRNDRITELLKDQNLDRRRQERIRVNGTLAVQVMDSAGKPVSRPFKGEIQDISIGGMSFSNYFKTKKTALSLLGRRIAIVCKLRAQGSWHEIKKLSQVVAVQSHSFSEYSFHIRFDRPISTELVNSLDTSESSGKSPDLDLEI